MCEYPLEMTREDIMQCLYDSRCDEATSRQIMEKLQSEDQRGALKILACHRKELMDNVHEKQKCVDCLDYLAWQMKNVTNS